VVQLDVAGGCAAILQTKGLAHNKGDSLGLGFLQGFGGRGAALGLIQQFLCLCSVRQNAECGIFGTLLPPGF
jgi:hypothetical protein